MNLISKIKKNKTLVNGSLFSLFSFFNQGISFILLIILANFIAPAEYGQLSLFNTLIMFLGYFIVLSSDGFLSISYFKTTKLEFSRDVSSILLVLISMTVFFLLIVYLGGQTLASSLKLSQRLLVIAVLVSSLHVLVNINLNLRRVKEQLSVYGLLSCGFAILNFVLSLVLIVGFNLNWLGRVYAQLACMVVFASIAILVLLKENYVTTKISKNRLKEILFWGIPLIPHLSTAWLRQGCDRYIIDAHYTLAEVGLFSFALNLSNVIEVLGSSFNASNSVSIYKLLSDKTTHKSEKLERIRKLSKDMILIFVVATLLIVVGGSTLIPIFMPKYNSSIPYFIILGGYGFLRCIYYIYCNYLFYWSKNKHLMYITISFAIVHLLLSLLLTRYSLLATAMIYVIVQLAIDVAIYVYAIRLLNKNLK